MPRPAAATLGLVLSLVATLGALLHSRPVAAAATIRCESVDFRDNYCAAETGGGVRMSRQISRAPCRQGSSWGYDRHGIWVTEGCGAEFELRAPRDEGGAGNSRDPSVVHSDGRAPPGKPDEEITCESRDYRYHYCPVRNAREVELVRQLSSSSCRYKRNWGYDRGGIWVDQGCAAVFLTR
jgi:hypothetical protein